MVAIVGTIKYTEDATGAVFVIVAAMSVGLVPLAVWLFILLNADSKQTRKRRAAEISAG